MQKLALPLALAVALVLAGFLFTEARDIRVMLRDLIPKDETTNVRLMEPQQVMLTKTWCNQECGTVMVKTTFREQGHGNETYEQFVARHNDAVAALMALCPENC